MLVSEDVGHNTSASLTGFCEVFASSCTVLGSCLRSFLHPTRMMGRLWQKCRTSEIHCEERLVLVIIISHIDLSDFEPSPVRCQGNPGNRWRNRLGSHASQGMREDGDDRNPLVQLYPTMLIRHVYHQPRHRQRSSRRRLERRPSMETLEAR